MPGTSTVYYFNYPTINSAGESIVLSSALVAWTPEDRQKTDSIETIHIYSHATIGADEERPTSTGFSKEQIVLQTLPRRSYKSYDGIAANYMGRCIIIAPDYECFGLTKALPHPYLSQRLTAQQVLDAAYYGIKLYRKQSAEKTANNPLLPLKSDGARLPLVILRVAQSRWPCNALLKKKGCQSSCTFMAASAETGHTTS